VGIAENLLERTGDDAAVTRLLFYSALRNRELSGRFFRTYGQEKLDLLADYIRKAISNGQFRPLNPVLAARSFLGMIVYHYLVEEIFATAHRQALSTHAIAQQLTGIFLAGISSPGRVDSNGRKGSSAGLRARRRDETFVRVAAEP